MTMSETSIDYLMPKLNEAVAILVKPAHHIRDVKYISFNSLNSSFEVNSIDSRIKLTKYFDEHKSTFISIGIFI